MKLGPFSIRRAVKAEIFSFENSLLTKYCRSIDKIWPEDSYKTDLLMVNFPDF